MTEREKRSARKRWRLYKQQVRAKQRKFLKVKVHLNLPQAHVLHIKSYQAKKNEK